MGAAFSSIMMIFGSLTTAVLSAIAAREAAKGNWAKMKMWGYIAMGATALVLVLSLALLIKSKSSSSIAAVGAPAPGFNIAVILMIIVMSSMLGLDIYGIVEGTTASGQKTRKAEEMFAASATVGFGGTIIALVIIVFLM